MKMREQRWIGLAFVIISGLMLALAASGETMEERDATAVLFTLPLGLYMMFSDTLILGQDDAPESSRDPPEAAKLEPQGKVIPLPKATAERKEQYYGKKASH